VAKLVPKIRSYLEVAMEDFSGVMMVPLLLKSSQETNMSKILTERQDARGQGRQVAVVVVVVTMTTGSLLL